MKNICIIPARGGSKRIPRKNIKHFMGKPIIAYSIDAALKSDLFEEVVVSTDDNEIAEVAIKYGAKVPFMRTAETANDYAGTDDVILEVLEMYKERGKEFDTFCCLYPTAPFVTSEKIFKAYTELNEKIDSIFTCVAYSYPVQRSLHIVDGKISMVQSEYFDARSQDLETIYHDAGQFYIATINSYLKEKKIWGANTAGFILSELEVQDLDTLTDWTLAEMKYKLLHK